ncbi:MAG TPA: hypothetical protein VE173_05090, partial [Longimicrobiales bacterium]|nr:hypothetical protein [Longimicrobiales bacterium]
EGEGREDPPSGDHPYASDLHVEGNASLRRLAGPVTSEAGRRTLRRWLLEPADPTGVRLRQEAVAELAGDLDFRMELTVRGRLAGDAPRGALDDLVGWARGRPALLEDSVVRVAVWTLPPLTLVLVTFQILGSLPALWILPFVLQLLVLRRSGRRLGGDLLRAAHGAPALRSHGPQLRLVEEARRGAELLRELARRLDVTDEPAHVRLDRLSRLADVAESRHNLVYQMLNPVLLLDVYLGLALDRWRRRSGSHVEGWLEALGEVEALGALACLAHDHPDWSFPTWSEGSEETVLRARALGHPLLPPETCVRNDVEVGPPGTFLLVTGSNMSGKSTLLRALGANAVLAGAGGPVCATSFDVPPVRLHTSMLVVESLEEGVSRFMAELLRVRSIVMAARAEGPGTPPVLYLLDEVLQGTNTAERRVAARAILRHLLAAGALGAVTTHDLTLHAAPDLQQRARARHFRESVEQVDGGTRLTFDYVLRPGLATTRNALKLLEAVGLGGEAARAGEPVDEDPGPEG